MLTPISVLCNARGRQLLPSCLPLPAEACNAEQLSHSAMPQVAIWKMLKKCTQCSTCTLHPWVHVEDTMTYHSYGQHTYSSLRHTLSLVGSPPPPLFRHTLPIVHLLHAYFLAKVIFMALDGVILKPCRASLAAPACMSVSNSTKAMSWRPGTSRTSLNPGNLRNTNGISLHYIYKTKN